MYGNNYLFKRLFLLCFDIKSYFLPIVMAVAAIGIGAAQLGMGIANQEKARRERQAAANRMREAAQAKLEYAAKLDKDWSDNYGETTAQVASYYRNLTGESLRQQYQMTGDKALEQSYNNFQQQMKQLDTKINQMGMQNSSQALSALMQMSTQQMTNNAAINFETQLNKMKADQEVAQQKLAYNQTGQYLKQAAIDTQNQAYNMQFNAAQVEAGMAQEDMNAASQMASSGMNTMASGLNMAANWGMNQSNQKFQAQQNALSRQVEYDKMALTESIYEKAMSGYNRSMQQANTHYNNTINTVNGILSTGLSNPRSQSQMADAIINQQYTGGSYLLVK